MSDELELTVPANAYGRMPRGFLPGLHFEVPELGGGGPAAVADPVEPGAGPDPAPVPGAGGPGPDPVPAPSPAPPAPAAIDWNDPSVTAELERRADAALQARLAAAGLAPAPVEQPGFELDPWSDNFGDQLVGVLGAILDQRLGGVDTLMQERTVQGFEQTIEGSIAALTGANIEDPEAAKAAEFHGLDPEGIRFLGEAFATRVDPRSADPVNDALKQGATWLKGYTDRQRTDAVTEYRRQLGEIVDTPADAPTGGAALRMEQKTGGYDGVVDRFVSRFEN